MKWFRANVKHGSRTALLALAVQFALSFGHFHGSVAEAVPAIESGAALSSAADLIAAQTDNQSLQQHPASHHDSDRQPADHCAICAVMAMANTALFATPALLLYPQAIEFQYLTTEAEFVDLGTIRVAFQPRAPPVA